MSLVAILGILLAVSECAAAVAQILNPDNVGLSGILQAIIKGIQSLMGK